jgi:cell division protein FtsL
MIDSHIIYFIIIFITLLVSFYLIINSFGVSTIKYTNNDNDINFLQQKLSSLNYELNSIKSDISKPSEHKILKQKTSEPTINLNVNSDSNNNSLPIQPPIIFDPIANYDTAKLIDPLVDPRGRTSADQIPTPQVAFQFNFPTQGVLDRYHRIGLLIAIDKDDNDNSSYNYKEKIHKIRPSRKTRNNNYDDSLLSTDTNSTSSTSSYRGVQIAPSSSESIETFGNYPDEESNGILELIGKKVTDNWYKYFTSISKGNKIIKINVHNRNRRELYCGDEVFIPELHRWYRVKIDEMDMIEYNPYFF